MSMTARGKTMDLNNAPIAAEPVGCGNFCARKISATWWNFAPSRGVNHSFDTKVSGWTPTNVAAPRAVLPRDAGGLTHEQFLMKRKA
jgi:hypothetical protein